MIAFVFIRILYYDMKGVCLDQKFIDAKYVCSFSLGLPL